MYMKPNTISQIMKFAGTLKGIADSASKINGTEAVIVYKEALNNWAQFLEDIVDEEIEEEE